MSPVDDKELFKQLERYASEADFGKAHVSLRGKLSSGEYRRVPPKDATPEQVAEWRADIGLPARPRTTWPISRCRTARC